MAIRFDVPDDRVYLVDTLPAPGTTGLTVVGWWRLRVDTNTFTTYYRTSGPAGTPTIHTCAADATGQGINVFTPAGELNSGYTNAVDEWVAIAVVDNGAGVSLYVRPRGGTTSATSGAVGSGTPAEIWLGGRALTDNHEPLNGNAAYVRVFADALTQTEIEAEWASETAVSAAWADWPLVGDIQDVSGNARHLTVVAGTPVFETGPLDEPAANGPVWSRVRVSNPRLVRGRARVSGRINRAGRRTA